MENKVWVIDPTHSEIQFKVKHLVISTVTGNFRDFEGQVTTANKDDFEGAEVEFSAAVNSIDTNQEARDNHLKSPDFFDAENHPKLRFQSTSMKKTSGDNYTLAGNLTIKGKTNPVELQVEGGGQAKDFYGNTKAGFEVTGKISRKQFGLTWDGVTEAGAIVVSDEVKLILNIQLSAQG